MNKAEQGRIMIMSFMGMKMLANMAHMQCHLRECHVRIIKQVWLNNL